MSKLPTDVQPCSDPRCGIHARGADPASHDRICPRQILRAYDRADAIALLEQEVPPRDFESCRVSFRLKSEPLVAGQSARLVVDSETWQYAGDGTFSPIDVLPHRSGDTRRPRLRRMSTFRVDQMMLNGERWGQEQRKDDWRVDDILMGGRSQIAPHLKLPAELFSGTCAVLVYDRIDAKSPIEIVVTRTSGDVPARLFVSLTGEATFERRSIKIPSGQRLLSTQSAQITEICDQAIALSQFHIARDPWDWIVHDITVDDHSIFLQPGDVPGDMFAVNAINSFVKFPAVRAGSKVCVTVTYIGLDPEGREFDAELRGQDPDPADVGDPALSRNDLVGLANAVARITTAPEDLDLAAVQQRLDDETPTADDLLTAAKLIEQEAALPENEQFRAHDEDLVRRARLAAAVAQGSMQHG